MFSSTDWRVGHVNLSWSISYQLNTDWRVGHVNLSWSISYQFNYWK